MQLLSTHRQNLYDSTLTDETIERYGFYSVTQQQAVEILDTEVYSGGWAIPYPGSDFIKIRLDKKKGDSRYMGPAGKGIELFITLLAKEKDRDKECPYFFVEGEKKALALEQLGYASISISGVWGHKSKGHDLEQLNYLNLKDRISFIAFDSDKNKNKHVRKAELSLANSLKSRGAIVKIINLNPGLGKGIDDQIKNFKVNGNLKDFKSYYIDSAVYYKDYILQVRDDTDSTLAEFAGEVCRQYHVIYSADTFYAYKDGYYHAINEEEIQKLIINIKENDIRMAKVKEIVFFMKSCAHVMPDRVNDTKYLNLKNGLFDLDEYKLLSHTPEVLSTIQLSVKYNQFAKCELWLKTLNEIFQNNEEKINTLQEFSGLCLTPETKYEKALFCIGEGANGKSVVLNTVGEMIGQDNYSAVPLEQFSNPHYLANLFSKLVNISIEVNASSQVYDSTFKAVITGDAIEADEKYKHPFKFHPFCKLIFAVNNLPIVTDKTTAFFRRLLILRFGVEFEESKQNKNLRTELLKELDGIFIWSLAGLKRLRGRGYFEVTDAIKKEISDYRRENNNVISFIQEKCSVDNPNAYEAKDFIYSEYKLFCKDAGYRALSLIRFGKELQRQFKVKEKRSDTERGWEGVKVLKLGIVSSAEIDFSSSRDSE